MSKKDNLDFERVETVWLVPVDELRSWSGNPRRHDEEDLAVLQKSIETYGWTTPVVADLKTKRILAGHGRLEVAKRIGKDKVPVIFRDWEESKQTGYTIMDNRSAELSQWEPVKLRDLLIDLDGMGLNLSMAGFTNDDLNKMIEDAFFTAEDQESKEAKKGAVRKDESGDIVEAFNILVKCRNEEEQIMLLDRLTEEGYLCRSLIS